MSSTWQRLGVHRWRYHTWLSAPISFSTYVLLAAMETGGWWADVPLVWPSMSLILFLGVFIGCCLRRRLHFLNLGWRESSLNSHRFATWRWAHHVGPILSVAGARHLHNSADLGLNTTRLRCQARLHTPRKMLFLVSRSLCLFPTVL